MLAVVYNKGATQKGSAPTKEGGQGYVYKLGLKNGKTPVEEKDPVRPSLLQRTCASSFLTSSLLLSADLHAWFVLPTSQQINWSLFISKP